MPEIPTLWKAEAEELQILAQSVLRLSTAKDDEGEEQEGHGEVGEDKEKGELLLMLKLSALRENLCEE